MKTVYVTQEPMKKRDGVWVSKGLNLSPATEYGTVKVIWPPDAYINNRQMVETRALEIAEEYKDGDYILATGSPTLMVALGWAIGLKGKRIQMLEWDHLLKRYFPPLL